MTTTLSIEETERLVAGALEALEGAIEVGDLTIETDTVTREIIKWIKKKRIWRK